ncbi:MAG: MATE family efflux transporter [Deltaproteobacteria bacterium]|nr:MATE family efflux transporter [Deltaproteobacteria bacterium]
MPKSLLQKWKEILSIAWPLIIANGFWNIQLTIDRVFLGSHATESLGAAMAVMGVFWTPMALLQQTACYCTTFVAQYFGAKENQKIGASLWHALYISIIGGILFLFLMFISPYFFKWIGHSPIIQGLESNYFNALCYSALPTAMVAAFSGFFTGLGKTRVVILINASGLLANAIFDYLLIFGKLGFTAYGIAGAGYATSIAAYVSAFVGAVLIYNEKNESLYCVKSAWRPTRDLFYRYFRFGLPSGLQWALEGLAFSVFLILMGRFQNGDAALASSSIVVTVMMIAILPAMGIAQAVMVLVGQHLGEKKPELAEEASWSGVQVSSIYIACVALSFLLIPEFYLSWFQNSQNLELWNEVKTIVPYLLAYVAFFTSFDSLNLNLSFALRGAGDTRFVSLVALIVPWPLMIMPTYLTSHFEKAVYWAWAFASLFIVSQAIIFWRRFVGGKWKSMSVIS